MMVEEDGLSRPQYRATLGLIVAFRLLATPAVLGRLIQSRRSSTRLSLDYASVVIASAFFWIQAVVEVVRTTKARRRNDDLSTTDQFEAFMKLLLVTNILYPVVLTCARLAISLRVTQQHDLPPRYTGESSPKKQRKGVEPAIVSLMMNGLWCIFVILVSTLQCRPQSAFWQPNIRERSCLPITAVALAITSWDVLCSLLTAATAINPIRKAASWRSSKIALIGLGTTGFLTIAVGVARIAIAATLSYSQYIQSSAVFEALAPVECSFAIIAACINHPGPSTIQAVPRIPKRNNKERLRAWRDRILIGKDTYNYKHVSRDSTGHEGLLARPQQASLLRSGSVQVQSTPVILPRSPFDPLPRFADIRRVGSTGSQHIAIQQEVRVEMENLPRQRDSDIENGL